MDAYRAAAAAGATPREALTEVVDLLIEETLAGLGDHGASGRNTMEKVTAVEMARAAGVNPKKFRRALRQENFPWHEHSDRWTVGLDSPEHRDMSRVLEHLRQN